MRVPRVARLATEAEADANFFADALEALEHHDGALGAEFGGVQGAFVDAGDRRVRVKVVGVPCCSKGVGGEAGFMGSDGEVELW